MTDNKVCRYCGNEHGMMGDVVCEFGFNKNGMLMGYEGDKHKWFALDIVIKPLAPPKRTLEQIEADLRMINLMIIRKNYDWKGEVKQRGISEKGNEGVELQQDAQV
jgi:hypothetical protein